MDASKEIILTPEGKQKLEEELRWREGEERERITEAIKVARDFGDLSENSEYDDAREEQANNESRISILHHQLDNCVIIDSPRKGGRIGVGHVVTLEDEKGKQRVYTLVGSVEADPKAGKISNESPLGKALMDHKKGDKVSFLSPTGKTISYTVLEVESN